MPAELELDRFEVDGVTVFALPPEIDNRGALELEAHLGEAISDGRRWILLDVAELWEISSLGLRVLLRLDKRLDLEGGGLALCGLQPEILRVLEMARMTDAFQVFADRRHGIDFLRRREELGRRARLALELLRERDPESGAAPARRPLRDGGRTVGVAASLLADWAKDD